MLQGNILSGKDGDCLKKDEVIICCIKIENIKKLFHHLLNLKKSVLFSVKNLVLFIDV